ncbi:MAG: hypothetical protein ABSC95_05030 [Acetobacteraceae bacterium]
MAIYVALMAPVLSGAVALGVEVTSWSGAQLDAQRAADASARQAAIYCYNYAVNNAGSGCLSNSTAAQTAATLAARLAEVNGVTGASSPTWNASTKTYSDNQVTAQIVSGVKSSSDAAILVSVQKSIPLTVSRAFSATSSVTVSATSTAEVVSTTTGGGGGQPCLVALAGDSNGTTSGTDISMSGSFVITAPTCTIRSDQGISMSGSADVTTAGLYAGGTISTSGSIMIVGPEYQTAGQIADPYISDTTLQNALTTANSATGSSITCSGSSSCTGPTGWGSCSAGRCTVNPGTYSGLSVSGSTNFVFNPGLYTINGNISFSGSTNISGSGVTILMGKGSGNTFTTSGSTIVSLSAATTASATGGAIPGILIASQSTGGSSFSGSSGLGFTGVIYYPNGPLSISGSAASGSATCAEVVAYTITLSGSADLASSCSTYGAATFGSLPVTTTYTTALVK